MCICMFCLACIHVCVPVFFGACACEVMYVCTWLCACVCMCLCMFGVCVHMCACVCVRARKCRALCSRASAHVPMQRSVCAGLLYDGGRAQTLAFALRACAIGALTTSAFLLHNHRLAICTGFAICRML